MSHSSCTTHHFQAQAFNSQSRLRCAGIRELSNDSRWHASGRFFFCSLTCSMVLASCVDWLILKTMVSRVDVPRRRRRGLRFAGLFAPNVVRIERASLQHVSGDKKNVLFGPLRKDHQFSVALVALVFVHTPKSPCLAKATEATAFLSRRSLRHHWIRWFGSSMLPPLSLRQKMVSTSLFVSLTSPSPSSRNCLAQVVA